MLASVLLQFTPLRTDAATERRALETVIEQQLQDYRSGLPLRSPAAGASLPEIPLTYQLWGMQYGQRNDQTLPSVEAIADLFQRDGVDGRLLLLGEPGMGKTHTLLALGDLLLKRTRQRGGPIPVLIDLSAWAGENLDQWLIHYLWQEYRLCQPIATDWLQTAQLTLLLDGFDHLDTPQQRGCAKELDTLLRTNPNQTAVLCCRRRVLESSGINFSYFNSGVHLVPLAAQQVKAAVLAYQCPDLWPQIKASKALQPLARLPLNLMMLVVLAPAISAGALTITDQESLVQSYLSHQLAGGAAAAKAEESAALRWLATQLGGRSRFFRLDQLQRTWLPEAQRLLYRVVLGLVLLLIFGLVGGNWGLGLAVGMVFSQLDVESFPYTRLSLATASWRGVGILATASGLLSLLVGVSLGGLAALVLGRFNLGLPAFGWVGLTGAVLGWGLGLGLVLWGGLPQAIQLRRSPNQDGVLALRNLVLLMGILALVLTLVLVLPAGMAGQSPLTLLTPPRLRVLVASLISAALWLSCTLQQSIVRLLLMVGRESKWPWACQPALRRWVNQRVLRQLGGSYTFSHELLRQSLTP